MNPHGPFRVVAIVAFSAALLAGCASHPAASRPASRVYHVQPGDTGLKIAMKHRMNLSDLAALNPGVDWTRLNIGQQVQLTDGK